MLGADVLDVLDRAQRTAVRGCRQGKAQDLIHGARHWIVGSVTLFLSPTVLTYRELREVVSGMEYWMQSEPWMWPSTYDVYVTGQGKTDWAFKGWLRLFAPDDAVAATNRMEKQSTLIRHNQHTPLDPIKPPPQPPRPPPMQREISVQVQQNQTRKVLHSSQSMRQGIAILLPDPHGEANRGSDRPGKGTATEENAAEYGTEDSTDGGGRAADDHGADHEEARATVRVPADEAAEERVDSCLRKLAYVLITDKYHRHASMSKRDMTYLVPSHITQYYARS
ncbi:MAG: hypothetical protein Q9222_004986 [Ikaeria aurantiellina]